jgi:hypothetical protein
MLETVKLLFTIKGRKQSLDFVEATHVKSIDGNPVFF